MESRAVFLVFFKKTKKKLVYDENGTFVHWNTFILYIVMVLRTEQLVRASAASVLIVQAVTFGGHLIA